MLIMPSINAMDSQHVRILTLDKAGKNAHISVPYEIATQLELYNVYGQTDDDGKKILNLRHITEHNSIKSFLTSESLIITLKCIKDSNFCNQLKKEDIIPTWRAFQFLDVPQKQYASLAKRIYKENLLHKLSASERGQLLLEYRPLDDALFRCKAHKGKLDLSNKKITENVLPIYERKGFIRPSIYTLPTLRKLFIFGRSRLQGVRDLNLSQNLLTTIDIPYYMHLFPNASTINLSHNDIVQISDETFTQLPTGSTVDLSNNKLTDQTVDEKAFADKEDCRFILTGNTLSSDKITAIRRMLEQKSLINNIRYKFWVSNQEEHPIQNARTDLAAAATVLSLLILYELKIKPIIEKKIHAISKPIEKTSSLYYWFRCTTYNPAVLQRVRFHHNHNPNNLRIFSKMYSLVSYYAVNILSNILLTKDFSPSEITSEAFQALPKIKTIAFRELYNELRTRLHSLTNQHQPEVLRQVLARVFAFAFLYLSPLPSIKDKLPAIALMEGASTIYDAVVIRSQAIPWLYQHDFRLIKQLLGKQFKENKLIF